MRVLGISAYYHDSAAALVVDGAIVAAAQEERFTRRKQDASFPMHAIRYCLAEGGVRLADVDAVVFYEKPFLKFERLLETYLSVVPRGFRQFVMAMPLWLREKLFQKRLLTDELRALDPGFEPDRLHFSEHHLSHAASAFYPSPYERALILTLDGVGEWATSAASIGHGNRVEMLKELRFPHSLGLLLNRIVSPLVLGLLFFAVVTPIGLLMRMFGQRPLALGFHKTATSYWVVRTEPTAPPGSMRKQF